MNIGIIHNGVYVQVIVEHGHYLLKAEGKEQRCDFGEVNLAVPEFVDEILKKECMRA
ncbi:hypothetical protein AALB39_04220 [Lachnospiraceae bacterium 54-53]